VTTSTRDDRFQRAGRRDERGFTVLEMLVSLAIMLVVTGGIFKLADTTQGGMRTQPEVADMHQRLRIAADMIYRDLLMAGAGLERGPASGSLNRFLPAIRPSRRGLSKPDAPLAAAADRISILFVPQTRAQTGLAGDMSSPATDLTVSPTAPGCPGGGPCGFSAGMPVLLVDSSGVGAGYELFQVTGTGASTIQHAAPNPTFTKAYLQNAGQLSEVEQHVYYLDSTARQLMHYDGRDTDEVLVDNVVGLTFTYFADPDPSRVPEPPPGMSSCLYDPGDPPKPLLAPLGGTALQPLTLSQLSDGPVCGLGGNQFDGDLMRIRKVRVSIRIQASTADLRGKDSKTFASAGAATDGRRYVPDYSMNFDVSPRNLNLIR